MTILRPVLGLLTVGTVFKVALNRGIFKVNGNVFQLKWEGKFIREIPMKTMIFGLQVPFLISSVLSIITIALTCFLSDDKISKADRESYRSMAYGFLGINCFTIGALEIWKRVLLK